ncbi:hypothetical protein QBC42DRAFT_269864 [Cladorrhinum samala]|uniref:Potassium channel domain-containing protein n=1 Tax=Cladorrhinum samala TaxID=585594 RepID=A0AAV9HLA8_9PEZI|nr:hypothetical protein QBC42DRAFT_269864 [Cladorrhinum samala]
MNDAAGEKIDYHVRAAEPNGKKLPKRKKEDDQPSYLDPSRWWFASAAFPMMAGTLGPAATAFSICAFARPWREKYTPGSEVDSATYIKDPHWLLIINGIQLILALIANIALLLNMTKRLRFSIAQPVTIVGWYASSICLIALTATASGPLVVQPEDEYIWSQAFFYGIHAAILYFFVASLMLITFLGALGGHYPKDFVLTASQRTLMTQNIMLLFYLLIGALVFSKIEGWDYLDAVYWSTVTLFTVGFGDLSPQSNLGRALLIPFALIGIISLGLVIGSIRSLALDRGRRRLSARLLEKKRRRMLQDLAAKGEDRILEPVSNGPAATSPTRDDGKLTEYERREMEFKLMREIQKTAARKRRWYALAISTTTWLILWLASAKIFQRYEARYQTWSYFDAVYFTFISLTTIGYGDITPTSNAGRAFWVFWALLALPTMTVVISNAGETVVKTIRDLSDMLATLTILPGDQPFKQDLKRFLAKLSCGILFDEDIETTPPGFHGDAQRLSSSSESDSELESGPNPQQPSDEAPPSAPVTPPIQSNRSNPKSKPFPKFFLFSPHKSSKSAKQEKEQPSSPSNSPPPSPPPPPPPPPVPPPLPSKKEDYFITLLDEIAKVTSHLKHHPPKKYSFHEWAWYLRLIGEDEVDSDRHWRAQLRHDGGGTHEKKGRCKSMLAKVKSTGKGPDEKGKEKDTVIDKDGRAGKYDHEHKEDQDAIKRDQNHPWAWGSWVGPKSPLMGDKEEAEWILERLIERLGEELREMREGKTKRGGEGSSDAWEGGS